MQKNQSNRNIKGVPLVLVDDNLSFRKVLKRLLMNQFGCEIVAEASSGEELLSFANLSFEEIILIDIIKPRMDGFNTAKKINWINPKAKIIAITDNEEDILLKTLIEKGFKGCINKNRLYDTIIEAIATVQDNHYYFPEDIDIK